MPGRKGHPDKVYSSAAPRSALGGKVDSFSFVHADTGCGTTSAVYRKGKRVPFRKLQAQPALCTAVQVFNDPQASKNAVAAAGEVFLWLVYGDRRQLGRQEAPTLLADHCETESVCEIRLGDSATNVSSCTSTLVPGIPPSTALDPTDWGWRLKDGRLTPLPTLREPAPERLIHLITCNCRSGCERNCRRSGLPCTSMCGLCAGHGCSNHDTSDDTSDGEDYTSWSDEDELDAAPVPKRRRP